MHLSGTNNKLTNLSRFAESKVAVDKIAIHQPLVIGGKLAKIASINKSSKKCDY